MCFNTIPVDILVSQLQGKGGEIASQLKILLEGWFLEGLRTLLGNTQAQQAVGVLAC